MLVIFLPWIVDVNLCFFVYVVLGKNNFLIREYYRTFVSNISDFLSDGLYPLPHWMYVKI